MARPKKNEETSASPVITQPVKTADDVFVISVVGYCVSPLTGEKYDSTPTAYTTRDGWVESQLAAGLFQTVKVNPVAE